MAVIKQGSIMEVLVTNDSMGDEYGCSYTVEVVIPKDMSVAKAQSFCRRKINKIIKKERSQIVTISLKN